MRRSRAGCAGRPPLSDIGHIHYFTGRSDSFDPNRLSTDADDARFYPESLRVSNVTDTRWSR